ncbi:dorsal-ventral patterning tolloid-like protein 1 [Ylistrum balloti]|uniref:dorsal-ventral patterning tolloid-like protein 1 n=1 Tax=Ylistrum balloti TaxID=509963 RepID=UPI0029059511|nr:dorsal-ventral patterning tolloid-like protein 1 [Ylistrum balloti]
MCRLCIEKDETSTGSGREFLYLRTDCKNKRNITTSLLVIIGLFHEHQRPDRDQYIQVHMDNVQDDVRKSFKRLTSNNTNQFGFPYDFHSITHYGQYAYAKNTSLPTITTNVTEVGFGENTVLSYYDVRKVQMLYSCAKVSGYAMFRGQLNLFKQEAFDKFYPQWHNSSEDLPVYMKRDCYKNSTDIYTLTVLHGAKWTSKLPLPPGNFSISVDVCIATFSNAIKSFIEMKMGTDTSRFDHLKPSQRGQWENLNVTYTSLAEWNLVLKAHILWGEDVLAVDNLVVTPNV